jgi:hypothetical protein
MNAFLSFPSRLQWDSQTLAEAVPVRMRLHELFAFDARQHDVAAANGNREQVARPGWHQHEYVRAADFPIRFQIR